MVTARSEEKENLISLSITKEINTVAFNAICRQLSQRTTHGPMRILLMVRHYPSFNSAEDLYYDFRFLRLFADHIHRVAVVSDRTWKHTWVSLFALFSGIEMDFFPMDQVQSALNWLSSES